MHANHREASSRHTSPWPDSLQGKSSNQAPNVYCLDREAGTQTDKAESMLNVVFAALSDPTLDSDDPVYACGARRHRSLHPVSVQ